MNWKIDQEALEKAKDILGIDCPVLVRVSKLPAVGKYHGLMRWGPCSDVRLDQPTHHISLDEGLGPIIANTALWHELTHAAQCEDFMPDDNDHRIANAGLRQDFGKEIREQRLSRGLGAGSFGAWYGDVSFEVEARQFMEHARNIDIIVPVDDGNDDKLNGYKNLWRVDMWDDDEKFVGTTYVLANEEWDAKKWARDNHMKGMKYSMDVFANPINSREGGE